MNKVAFIFPGQGAQYAGMGREFYQTNPVSRAVYDQAEALTGLPITEICFEENERLHQTRYTQPALLTTELAILAALEAEGMKADMTAGLSLGEYGALAASHAMSREDAIRTVVHRGIFMEEAVPNGKGMMMAILYRKEIPMEKICQDTPGIVSVANYNCPGQRVITGEKEAVEAAAKKLLEEGAMRAIPLNVSGPFHSQMLQEAGRKLDLLLREGIGEAGDILHRPDIPFISNVTAVAEQNPESIRVLLGRQVCSSVLWEQSVEYMLKNGVHTFVEIGPGQTLSKFIQKIDKKASVYHVEKPEDIRTLKGALAAC